MARGSRHDRSDKALILSVQAWRKGGRASTLGGFLNEASAAGFWFLGLVSVVPEQALEEIEDLQ